MATPEIDYDKIAQHLAELVKIELAKTVDFPFEIKGFQHERFDRPVRVFRFESEQLGLWYQCCELDLDLFQRFLRKIRQPPTQPEILVEVSTSGGDPLVAWIGEAEAHILQRTAEILVPMATDSFKDALQIKQGRLA